MQRAEVMQVRGRNMKSSNTNNVSNAKIQKPKPMKANNNANVRAKVVNLREVAKMKNAQPVPLTKADVIKQLVY